MYMKLIPKISLKFTHEPMREHACMHACARESGGEEDLNVTKSDIFSSLILMIWSVTSCSCVRMHRHTMKKHLWYMRIPLFFSQYLQMPDSVLSKKENQMKMISHEVSMACERLNIYMNLVYMGSILSRSGCYSQGWQYTTSTISLLSRSGPYYTPYLFCFKI